MKDRFAEHLRLAGLAVEQTPLLERIADRIVEVFGGGGKLYVFGNGGSAADAQHIAAELVGRFRRERQALPAVALTTDTSILTAVTNDLGGEKIFQRQVEALVTSSDIVWALSVSGSSPNIVAALELARKIGASVIGFTGLAGEKLRALSDLSFTVDSDSSDRVQELHQLAYHVVCERIENRACEGGKRKDER